MPLGAILGQDALIERLRSAHRLDKLPSAYLLVGLAGLGKASLAKFFAQEINCECGGRNECESCRLFGEGSHPDFLVIRQKGQNIRIEQIQKLIDDLSLKPVLAKKRVVLLKKVETMNLESANAFLKILEEPPLDTLFLLTAEEESLLMDTILSRCQRHHLLPIAEEPLRRILLELKPDLDEDALGLLLAYGSGRIRKHWLDKTDRLLGLRSQAWHMLTNLTDSQMEGHMLQIEHALSQDLHAPLLEFLGTLLRDWILVSHATKVEEASAAEILAQVRNRDMIEDLTQYGSMEESLLERAFDQVLETDMRLGLPASKALSLEALLIHLKQLFAHEILV